MSLESGGTRWKKMGEILEVWDLVLPNGEPVATVYEDGTWFTWDSQGAGGHNSKAGSMEEAKKQAHLAALNQGFITVDTISPRSEEPTIEFSNLWLGDRFSLANKPEAIWTKIAKDTARHHSALSVALGHNGYGYISDDLCSFMASELVIFVPPKLTTEQPEGHDTE